jgi:hypothetical protein
MPSDTERSAETLAPPPSGDHSAMAPLTEARFKAILHEVVGAKILEIYELVKKIPLIQDVQEDHEKRIRKLERQVGRLLDDASAD